MKNDMKEILITKEQIASRIKELAVDITTDYKDKKPLLVCVLKGAILFFSDLCRELDFPLTMDFISIASYEGGTQSTGEVRLVKDIDESARGRNVIIIEDIVDTGLTLDYLVKYFENKGADSVKVATLLNKQSGRKINIKADYIAFEIEDQFVVGYGLDYAQEYRNFGEVGILKQEIYTKK